MEEKGAKTAAAESPSKQSACAEHYEALVYALSATLKQTIANDEAKLALGHAALRPLSEWVGALSKRVEYPVYALAVHQYQQALLSAGVGLYRAAFFDLRSFVELSLAAIDFSANEFQFRLWLNGRADIVWARLIDPDNGVFSTQFANAFFEELADDAHAFRKAAEKLYRECSEYVHCSPISRTPEKLIFDKGLFEEWHRKCESAVTIFQFSLALRFLRFFSKDELKKLEPYILQELGHLSAVRGFLGATI